MQKSENQEKSKSENKIKILDDALIDKIAAGEVVENPCSVVKELVENSIDAGSDFIEIEISEGGKSFIKVKDNGSGMSKEDASLSIKRHSTSKISSVEDLFAINTLGFRGEALASISAVSQFSLITRRKEDIKGTEVKVFKNNIQVNEIGCEKGTTIKVENLFYNVPARKKFLKTIESEESAIIDLITKMSLIYNHISFKLICDKKIVILTQKNTDEINTISSIYGAETAKNMIKLDYSAMINSNSLIHLSGYIGKPSIARSDKSRQILSINSRLVKSREISEAVKEAYSSLLFLDKEPIYLLKLKLDEKKVDVNVHPRKEIVKISNINEISECIKEGIRQTLMKSNLIPESFLKETNAKSQSYEFSKEHQSTLFSENSDFIKESGSVYQNVYPLLVSREINTKHIGPFKILGQINKMYIVAENAEGILIIDQHAAEERVNYERLMKSMKDNAIKKQELLNPLIIETSPYEYSILMKYRENLSKSGYDIEEYGKNNILVRSVPFIFERPSKILVHELIDELKEINEKKISSQIEERIIRFSCRKSIKAGEEMTFKQIESLIIELDKCDLPFTCPHGRPTIISITLSEIEKKFKRS